VTRVAVIAAVIATGISAARSLNGPTERAFLVRESPFAGSPRGCRRW